MSTNRVNHPMTPVEILFAGWLSRIAVGALSKGTPSALTTTKRRHGVLGLRGIGRISGRSMRLITELCG